MEKKYGVSLSQLKQLKEFQLALRSKREKTEPEEVMNVIGNVETKIYFNENPEPWACRLSVDKDRILIEPSPFGTSSISSGLRQLASVNVTGNDVTIHHRTPWLYSRCTFYFNENQRQNFLASLPPIPIPDNDQVNTDDSSEESDLNIDPS